MLSLTSACTEASTVGQASAAAERDASAESARGVPLTDAGAPARVLPRPPTPDNVIPPERCSTTTAPDVIMFSPAGELVGGYASSCISCMLNDKEGITTCADGPTLITGYAIIHPGDSLTFSMPDGTIMGGGKLCMPACPPQIRISDLACPSAPEIVHEISEDVPIDIDLPKGQYLVTFSSHFEHGRQSGSMGAGFGLIVDPLAERKVVDDPNQPKPEERCSDSDADAG